MNTLFDINGPVASKLIKAADCVLLSLLWFVFSMPIITMGASTAALYGTVYKYIRNDRGKLFSTFLNEFKGNFKRSTVIWLISFIIEFFIVADVMIFRSKKLNSEPIGEFYYVMLIVFLISVTWCVYTAAYSARFNGSVKEVMKLSFLLMLLHPIRALSVLLVILAGAVLAITVPGLIPILPAPAFWLCSILLEKVFIRHMQPEDIEKMQAENEQ